MQKFHSKTTGGFYPEDMRADYEAAGTWPDDAVEVTEAEEATIRSTPVAMSPDQIKMATNANIQSQIDAIERGQARAVREAVIGTTGAVDRLKALDAKIAALRVGFVK